MGILNVRPSLVTPQPTVRDPRSTQVDRENARTIGSEVDGSTQTARTQIDPDADPNTSQGQQAPTDRREANSERPAHLRNVTAPSGDRLTIGDTVLERRRRRAARLIQSDVTRPGGPTREQAAPFPRFGFTSQMEETFRHQLIRAKFSGPY